MADQPDRRPDDRRLDVGSFIREQRLLGRISLRGLSEAAGVSNPYLSQIERGLRRPSAEILRQIAQALQISAETLYVHAGILDEPTDEVDVVSTINRDRHLDDEQKRALVHIYQSFRAQHAAAHGTDEVDEVDPLDEVDTLVEVDGSADGAESAVLDPPDEGSMTPLVATAIGSDAARPDATGPEPSDAERSARDSEVAAER